MPREFLGGEGASQAPELIEIHNLDTNCDHCFATADKVYYNVNKKTLLVVCTNNHQSVVEGNWERLLGLEN